MGVSMQTRRQLEAIPDLGGRAASPTYQTAGCDRSDKFDLCKFVILNCILASSG